MKNKSKCKKRTWRKSSKSWQKPWIRLRMKLLKQAFKWKIATTTACSQERKLNQRYRCWVNFQMISIESKWLINMSHSTLLLHLLGNLMIFNMKTSTILSNSPTSTTQCANTNQLFEATTKWRHKSATKLSIGANKEIWASKTPKSRMKDRIYQVNFNKEQD